MQHLTPELVTARLADLQREAHERSLVREARHRPSSATPGALRRRLGEGMVSLGSRLRGEPPCPQPRERRAAA